MRTLILGLAMALAIAVTAQSGDYVQYELVYLKPDGKNIATLRKNMKEHNEQFHSGGPYHATVWLVANGPKTGWWVWQMGPCTYAQLDARPANSAHDENWQNKILPYIDEQTHGEYWRRDDDLSNIIEGAAPSANIYIRFHKLRDGKGYLLDDELKKISEVFKNMEGDNAFFVYDNEFRQGNIGRHLATITPFEKWAELDEDDKFKETFERLYGESAWMPFVRTMGEVMEDQYDEIWTRVPDLSGKSE